jgi:hypothetical protein
LLLGSKLGLCAQGFTARDGSSPNEPRDIKVAGMSLQLRFIYRPRSPVADLA